MNLSIITINYNDAAGLIRTMQSVFNQRDATFEYLVIDGGSTDDSLEVIRSQAAKLAYWISERDHGIYDAMNKGIAQATGDYLLFLNSGDLLATSTTLHRCLQELAQQPIVDVLYGDVLLIDPIQPTQNAGNWRYPDKLTLGFFRKQTLNHQASLFRKSLFEEFGLYPVQHKLAADYWLYLNSMLHSKHFRHLDAFLVQYDRSGLSATNSYQRYVAEMQVIWQSLVPPYVQELVDENHQLRDITDARLVRLAAAGNRLLRKLTHK